MTCFGGHLSCFRGDVPVIATPTTMVQKRLPCRTLSGDFRIISDLRFTNLYCEKKAYPEAKLTDAKQIAEKSISTKMRWPHVKVVCDKRDIDAAFKRVRLRPDACLILRTEFDSPYTGDRRRRSFRVVHVHCIAFRMEINPSLFSNDRFGSHVDPPRIHI